MTRDLRSRLVDAGWSITIERHVEIDLRGDADGGERYSTLRASKGGDEVVVRVGIGREPDAFRELYREVKALDPVVQQIAQQDGSGAWVFDLSKGASVPDSLGAPEDNET
jgi:hypothetical protein